MCIGCIEKNIFKSKLDFNSSFRNFKVLITDNKMFYFEDFYNNSLNNEIIEDSEEFKYEEAVRQLEDIVEKLQNDELDIDSMSENLKKAQKLIKLCKDKLTKTDDEINKILEKDKK